MDTKSRLLLTIITVLFVSSSYAAELPVPVTRIDPARVKSSFEKPAKSQKKLVEKGLKKAEKIEKPTKQKFAIHFVLRKINLVGVTSYKPKDLKPLYKNYIGKKINFSDLNKIVTSITKKYRKDGYVLSQAVLPQQKIKNGVVKIKVIEGYISNYVIEGDPGSARSRLESYAKRIVKERPGNIKTIERYLLLANDIPGLEVRAVFRPSKTHVGASDIVLIAKEKRYDVGFSYDNRGSNYVGPHRVYANMDANNIFGQAGKLGLSLVGTPSTDELRFAELNYMQILNSSGLKFNILGDYVDSNPGFILDPLDVTGRSKFWAMNFSYPWLRSRKTNFATSLQFDWLDSEMDFPLAQLFIDHIRSVRLAATFDHIDKLRGTTKVKGELSKGLKAFGSSGNAVTDLTSRVGGRSDYTKFNLDLSRLQELGKGFSLLLAASGQYSFNNPLLSYEEFGYGGQQFGRAYDSSELAGDNGIAGKAELQLNTFPGLKFFKFAQYYAFYDAGMVWNIGLFNDQIKRVSATSGGVGVRAYLTKNVFGNLEITKPLTYPVETYLAMGRDGNSSRVFFTINALF